jgi:hypothetical protein
MANRGLGSLTRRLKIQHRQNKMSYLQIYEIIVKEIKKCELDPQFPGFDALPAHGISQEFAAAELSGFLEIESHGFFLQFVAMS